MENFLNRLNRNPYAQIDGASITRVDELGNGYDDWNNLIAPKFEQPQQTWGETALGVATAPARIATSLVESLSPYGADGWQIPPLVNEGANALSAVGDAYTQGMSDDEMRNRALGMASFMFAGGGPALALERSLAQRGINSTADMIPTAVKDYGTAKYLNWKYPDEEAVAQNFYPTGLKRFEDLPNYAPHVGEPSWERQFVRDMDYNWQDMKKPVNEAGEALSNTETGYMNALMQSRKPEFDVIDGGLYSNASKEGAIPALLGAGQEARLARARDMGFDTDKTYYHGTQAGNIEAFDMGRADTGWRGKAVHMADDPKLAEFYGGDRYSPGAIYPLHLRVNNTADYMSTNLPRDVFSESQLADITSYWGAGQADGFFGSGKMTPELASGGIGHDAMMDLLKSQGYDSLMDNGHMMVFDPKNIRSVNAAFDPAKSDSANLLAANADSRPALLGSGQEQDIPDWLLPYLGR